MSGERKPRQRRTPRERAEHELAVVIARREAAKAAKLQAIEASLAAGTAKDEAIAAYDLAEAEVEHARRHPALAKPAVSS